MSVSGFLALKDASTRTSALKKAPHFATTPYYKGADHSQRCLAPYFLGRCQVARAASRLVVRVAEVTADPAADQSVSLALVAPLPAHVVLKRFFEAFNARDIGTALDMIADDMVHHDLAFPHPYRGKEAVTNFYVDFVKQCPPDLKFVLEDVSEGDTHKCGAIWHMEVGGLEVPSSKGVSFYRTNSAGKIVTIRESPEHFIKVAQAIMPVVGAASPFLTPAFHQLVPLLDDLSGALENLPIPGKR